jgi:DNA-binding CsgD family transcriptional regulator
VVSRRELDVLRLVGAGLTNAQVARRLGIAEATVAKHLEHVFARTGARSRAQAVAMCAELIEDH